MFRTGEERYTELCTASHQFYGIRILQTVRENFELHSDLSVTSYLDKSENKYLCEEIWINGLPLVPPPQCRKEIPETVHYFANKVQFDLIYSQIRGRACVGTSVPRGSPSG